MTDGGQDCPPQDCPPGSQSWGGQSWGYSIIIMIWMNDNGDIYDDPAWGGLLTSLLLQLFSTADLRFEGRQPWSFNHNFVLEIFTFYMFFLDCLLSRSSLPLFSFPLEPAVTAQRSPILILILILTKRFKDEQEEVFFSTFYEKNRSMFHNVHLPLPTTPICESSFTHFWRIF